MNTFACVRDHPLDVTLRHDTPINLAEGAELVAAKELCKHSLRLVGLATLIEDRGEIEHIDRGGVDCGPLRRRFNSLLALFDLLSASSPSSPVHLAWTALE